jgi:hypothetical protein
VSGVNLRKTITRCAAGVVPMQSIFVAFMVEI